MGGTPGSAWQTSRKARGIGGVCIKPVSVIACRWCKLVRIDRIVKILLASVLSAAALAGELPDGDTLQRDGAVIGEISFDKANVFDLDDPAENNWLYRLANRWHIVTRDKVIAKQLLFRSGDPYQRPRGVSCVDPYTGPDG